MKISRIIGSLTSGALWLSFASSAFAQSATESASKGGTNGALPSAGTTELTYVLFIGGIILFVAGTIKLILSYRE